MLINCDYIKVQPRKLAEKITTKAIKYNVSIKIFWNPKSFKVSLRKIISPTSKYLLPMIVTLSYKIKWKKSTKLILYIIFYYEWIGQHHSYLSTTKQLQKPHIHMLRVLIINFLLRISSINTGKNYVKKLLGLRNSKSTIKANDFFGKEEKKIHEYTINQSINHPSIRIQARFRVIATIDLFHENDRLKKLHTFYYY